MESYDEGEIQVPNFALDLHLHPRFKHDGCSGCKYLGRFKEYDLYFCPQSGDKTVMARYGNEPSEYLSGWGSYMLPLMIAETMAHRKGYVNVTKRKIRSKAI